LPQRSVLLTRSNVSPRLSVPDGKDTCTDNVPEAALSLWKAAESDGTGQLAMAGWTSTGPMSAVDRGCPGAIATTATW